MGNLEIRVAFGRIPDDRQAVEKHRHRRGSLYRQGNPVGRVFQTEMLLAIKVRHFDRPTQ